MKRNEDHWRLYRYLRTPLVDVGIGEPVSHRAMRMPGENIGLFQDKSLATVVVDALEVPSAAEMVINKIRVGGHLICCELSPEALKKITATSQVQYGKYYGFHIIRRLSGRNGMEALRTNFEPTGGQKKVCIVRYGAIGDHLMATPLVQHYHQDGWHVTYNCTEKGEAVWKGDPRINDLIVQETDIVPPDQRIKTFWDKMSKDYDKFINLSEVVEENLLRIEGRPNFRDSWEKRMAECSGNYIDAHFERAGLDVRGEDPIIHLSNKEREWAFQQVEQARRKLGKNTIVLVNVMGSSFHKIYPWIFDVFNLVKENGDDIGFIAVGDEMSRFLTGNEFNKVVINLCGRLKLRQSIALHSAVDAVVTPETWSLIAGLGFDAPVVALLSHSAKSNYNWSEHDIQLHAPTDRCKCYPCHQLHYSRRSCPPGIIEKAATLCMDQIEPKTVYDAILKIHDQIEEDQREHDTSDTANADQAVHI